MNPVKVILNPAAGRGLSRKSEPELVSALKKMNLDFDLAHTREKGHAIELAETAAIDGFKTIVAVGGDGTSNEVVNGIMNASANGHEVVYAPFAGGSGSDFSYNIGMPKDLTAACRRLQEGKIRKVDLGKFTFPGMKPRYFDNQLGIGFDGTVTVVAKQYQNLRGMALYLPVVLQSIFVDSKPTHVKIKADDQEFELSTLQITVANANREGGGFFMAPDAKLDDGWFDICIVKALSRPGMFGIVPKFMSGKHVDHKATTMLRAKKISITSDDNLVSHFDGELLCTDGHEITCEIVPQCLNVIS